MLDELPTSAIASIVARLSPRLYIDFIQHLPPEICLKILGYLDPVSLVSVLRTCRAWYDLGLDRKLWERLYHLEGWKAIYSEIELCETKVNENINASIGKLSQVQSDGPANKVRGIISDDEDVDMSEADSASAPKDSFTSTSLFGSPTSSFSSSRRVMTPMMESEPSSFTNKGKGVDTSYMQSESGGKRKAPGDSPGPLNAPQLATDARPPMRSSLWTWDVSASQYRINWRYLYNTRRTLESNWDLGKYTTFILPDPRYPEEGHQECVYTIQFDAKYLVSGSRDRTMRIWDMNSRRLVREPLCGHAGSVLCLQFDSHPDEDIIVSGSSDSDVFIWKFSTGEILQRITKAHRESVLNVRFDKNILVTSSKDKTIKIFNRRPLRYGDLGYDTGMEVVQPVGVQVKPYGYEPDLAHELPIRPRYSQIARLDGHGAAVNAIQVRDNTIVSVSGDRQIKVWDWPRQVCEKTIPAHEKGIACVEFDGRRIVSGSSDYVVCVFDAATGLKVATLRGHGNLVRTVQAGFGDLPYSKIEDEIEARLADDEYRKAVESGETSHDDDRRSRRTRRANAQTLGAKVPPGGGGGQKYGRIVSGSYDQSIIIWRRDKEGFWKTAHHLRQEEAVELAHRQSTALYGPAPLPLVSGSALPIHTPNRHRATQSVTTAALNPAAGREMPSTDRRSAGLYMALIDQVVPLGVAALQQALATYPALLTYHTYLQATIEREASPFIRSQLRTAVTTALVGLQHGSARRQRAATETATAAPTAQAAVASASSSSSAAAAMAGPSAVEHVDQPDAITASPSSSATVRPPAAAVAAAVDEVDDEAITPPPAPAPVVARPHGHHHHHHHHHGTRHHPHLVSAENAPARVFKLQFDARKIVCCTQAPVIVGWDFCNGEPELEEVSRFFASID